MKSLNITLKTIFLVISLSFSLAIADDCHPQIDSSKSQFIFGYGSLISEKSFSQTLGKKTKLIPVKVSKLQRGWIVRGNSQTYLGVVKANVKLYLNGVLGKIDTIVDFDKRENNYCRKRIDNSDIVYLVDSLKPTNSEIWVYYINDDSIEYPSEEFPIKQSYLNMFIDGCIDIEKEYELENYANECVKTTFFWSKFLIDDKENYRNVSESDVVAAKNFLNKVFNKDKSSDELKKTNIKEFSLVDVPLNALKRLFSSFAS